MLTTAGEATLRRSSNVMGELLSASCGVAQLTIGGLLTQATALYVAGRSHPAGHSSGLWADKCTVGDGCHKQQRTCCRESWCPAERCDMQAGAYFNILQTHSDCKRCALAGALHSVPFSPSQPAGIPPTSSALL